MFSGAASPYSEETKTGNDSFTEAACGEIIKQKKEKRKKGKLGLAEEFVQLVLNNGPRAATNAISAAAPLCFTVFLLIRKSKKELDREPSKKDTLCTTTEAE